MTDVLLHCQPSDILRSDVSHHLFTQLNLTWLHGTHGGDKFHINSVKCVHLRSWLKLTHSVSMWAIVLALMSHAPPLDCVHLHCLLCARQHTERQRAPKIDHNASLAVAVESSNNAPPPSSLCPPLAPSTSAECSSW